MPPRLKRPLPPKNRGKIPAKDRKYSRALSETERLSQEHEPGALFRLWAAMLNTDTIEGRGRNEPRAFFHTKEEALLSPKKRWNYWESRH
jgi:hypothetical protein